MESREFYFELCRLLNSVSSRYDNYAKKNGVVSDNLLWIIYFLSDRKSRTQLEIAEHTCLPKTTVNTIIKDLEKNGYVSLVKGEDKRERVISLTDCGKVYADNLLKDLFHKEDQIFNGNKKLLVDFINQFDQFDNLLELLEK